VQHIVLTTINHPNDVYSNFVQKPNVQCVVIGDKKTPSNWYYPGTTFIGIEEQAHLGYCVEKYLPISHYSRKNIGYVYSKRNGAESIVDTDDDNFPASKWGYPIKSKSYLIANEDQGFINIYEYFQNADCWPRGFPLEEIIPSKGKMHSLLLEKSNKIPAVGIWQGLVNGDPDVDAIFRLTHDEKEIFFSENAPIVLSKGCYCPINSQNTYFARDLSPLLYLPVTVSFRFTDILRGYVAQVVCCHKGYMFGFCSPNVQQIRNKHSYIRDFQDEIPMYNNVIRVVDISEAEVKDSDSIEDNLFRIYRALAKEKIVTEHELITLNSFLKDMT